MRRPFLACCALVAALTGVARAGDPPPAARVPALAAPSVAGTIDASWAKAATLHLDHDFTYRRSATEPTEVRVAEDGTAIYVAFEVTQAEPLTANQHTNGSSVQSDDYVGVYLDPQGQRGFDYGFFANPNGARYQTSSENSAYSPEWIAVAKRTAGGYVVTMRIPLRIIRTAGSRVWSAQFVRFTVATNSLDVWAYSPVATTAIDPTFIGTLAGIGIAPAGGRGGAARNPVRIQPYVLGEATSHANGGSTSRVGADFSLPLTPTASFVGTVHPDYSNVETDQQTIAPTAFARQYVEVRPFFTQLASFFNAHTGCDNCTTTLYTPAIPVFSQGYGIEGTQGHTNFAAFDALGFDRTDQAETLNYNYADTKDSFGWELQRVNVAAYGLQDNTFTYDGGYIDQRTRLLVYTNNGVETGTLVTDPGLGTYHDGGIGYATALTTILAGIQRIGAQFDPLDGYTAQSDILGYQIYTSQMMNFSPSFWLHDILVTNYFARYNNHFDLLSQTDEDPQVNVDFRNLMTVHVYNASNGVRTFANEFLPFDQSGALLGYRINTNTPAYVAYTGGPYYHGHLDSWIYLATLPITRRVHLALETDEDKYLTAYPGELTTNQWLERTSLDWQPSKVLQFDVGLRRIIGGNLPNSFEPLTYAASSCAADPYLAGCFVNAGNVSLAAHFLYARNEFYLVYGNANDLSTEPALFLKWIRYVGAEKGT
ncbi:MAG TPA: sugar-binding protein [Candidatus Baltobacteraceae bacterium]|nr:sugar-binding protein [Candidatus Baltobacteraceae bacterium]